MHEENPIVFVVDDDGSIRESLQNLIQSMGLSVQTFASAPEFLTSQGANVPSCLVLDVELPGLSGLDLQEELAKADIQIPIVFITGHGDIPMTVRALKAGAIEFLTKPFRDEDLLNAVVQAINRSRQIGKSKNKPAEEKSLSENEPGGEVNFSEIVGQSSALRRVFEQIETVASTDSTVLIHGETGTGKELIARAIHNLSLRDSKPFVKLNCAAIPSGLLESEMFGHERGAFTGAISQRVGRFELASRGTMFLDEIGEVPLELQPKLLRVLQEREFERLGSTRTLRTDARLIAATNRDLEAMVAEQKFRSDLYYRLNVFPVRVPTLRERSEDIPLLVRHFVQKFSRQMSKAIETIPRETMTTLVEYQWPGNVRELQNVIERAVIVTKGSVLNILGDDLRLSNATLIPLAPNAAVNTSAFPKGDSHNMRTILDDTERKQILSALDQTNWIVAGPNGAAVRLGMKRSTLQSRMQKLGIRISRTGSLAYYR
jgi:formate hydrogenlyase transcriptional activator